MLGGGGVKNWPKKYNIDYFGYAVNLEFKFKLNFDQNRGSKFKKKIDYQEFMEIQINLFIYTKMFEGNSKSLQSHSVELNTSFWSCRFNPVSDA